MNSATSFDRINAALEDAGRFGRRSGAWTVYNCPAHEDSDPSLGVVYNPAKQRTVVRCFTGCADEDVLAAIGLRVADLYDDARRFTSRHAAPYRPRITPSPRPFPRTPRDDPLGPQSGPPRIAARYYYRLPDGTAAGRVTRAYIPHEKGTKRVFWQHQWDGHAWARGGFPTLLYHLPEVIAAVRDGRTIYLVEGEKDADNAIRAGLTATCNAMGAGKFRVQHADQLAGARRVVIVTDRDKAGRRHGAAIAELLRGRVGSVEIVESAVGKDISDHLAAGLGPDELVPVGPADPIVEGWAEVRIADAALWHGSAATGIRQLERAEEDTVGSGVYLAEKDIATGYAQHRARQAGTDTPTLYSVSVRDGRLVDLTDQTTVNRVMAGFQSVLATEQSLAERAERPSWLRINNLQDLREILHRGEIRVGELKRVTQRCGELFSSHLRAQGYAGLLTVEGGEADIGNHLTYLIFDPADITVTDESLLPVPSKTPAREDKSTVSDVHDPITVYTKPDCPQCAATKRSLDRLGVGYTEVDVSSDVGARRWLLGMGYTMAPVVVAGDSHFAGYRPDRLAALGESRNHPPDPISEQSEPGWHVDNGVITSAPLDEPADTWRVDNGVINAVDPTHRRPSVSTRPPAWAIQPASPTRPTHAHRR
ncbi:glutaredoxin domain-containing protein [Nocardia vaccinii]|uniref:glutaredoxin domain-containing protein n=1 Tax=Nocardia vaccinii TaxID=1822 RepID=UPI000834E079|nr:glutaredoxin domain-containing protein [Nocardia vaccinii]